MTARLLPAVFCGGPKGGRYEDVEAYYGTAWPHPLLTCMRTRPIPLGIDLEPNPGHYPEIPDLEQGDYELLGRYGTADRWVFVYEWKGWKPWPPVSS